MASQNVAPPTTTGQSPTPDRPPLELLSKGEFNYLVWFNVIVALTVTVLLIGFLGWPRGPAIVITLLCMFLAGACGATLCNLRGIFNYMDIKNGRFPRKLKVPFYLRPVTGALTGIVIFFVGHWMESSLANAQSVGWESLEGRLPYIGVALLAGFAAQEFMQRLKEVARTVFAVQEESEETAEELRYKPSREFHHSQGVHQMQNDISDLIALNIQIGVLESAGKELRDNKLPY